MEIKKFEKAQAIQAEIKKQKTNIMVLDRIYKKVTEYTCDKDFKLETSYCDYEYLNQNTIVIGIEEDKKRIQEIIDDLQKEFDNL